MAQTEPDVTQAIRTSARMSMAAPRDVAAVGRAVIVGRASDIPRALEHPAVASVRRLAVAGIVTVDEDESDHSARGAELDELVSSSRADTVLVAGPLGRDTMRIVTDIALLNACRVVAVMPSETVAGHEPLIVWEGDRPLVQLLGARHTSLQYAVKRAVDVLGSSLGLIALAPLFAAIALALRLDSSGPILFRHRRVGLGGRVFDCLKFRSMVADAEDRLREDPALFATYRENNFRVPDAADPRVTRIGRLLRRTSLDELPQLWNVLRGEMSLIGPRPVVTEELAHFAGSERLLLSVRPGMTGMWAVMGRHDVAYPARAEIELRYARTWSLRGDATIALKTVGAVLHYGSDLPA
jgi:lipopolysaccharide/colanic/teichoic acid biosynthesis glycosyltransferase